MLVESLQVQRSEFCQRDAADLRLNVVLEEALAGFEGGRSEFDFDIIFHPDLQPTAHGVGLGFGKAHELIPDAQIGSAGIGQRGEADGHAPGVSCSGDS